MGMIHVYMVMVSIYWLHFFWFKATFIYLQVCFYQFVIKTNGRALWKPFIFQVPMSLDTLGQSVKPLSDEVLIDAEGISQWAAMSICTSMEGYRHPLLHDLLFEYLLISETRFMHSPGLRVKCANDKPNSLLTSYLLLQYLNV